MTESNSKTRRDLMALAAAAGISFAAKTELTQAATNTKFDPADPIQNAHAYAKMEGNLLGLPNYHLAVGYILGFMPGQLPQILTGFQNIKVNKVVGQGDGSYLDTYSSVYMFTAPEGPDQLLSEWKNPFTGKRNQPFHYRSGPSRTVITPAGFKSPTRPDDPGNPNPFILPWLITGDQVVRRMNSAFWFPSDLSPEEWPLESPGDEMISSHYDMRTGSLAALTDPDIIHMSVTSFSNAQSNWLPWMLMGQIPGHVGYHTVGQSFSTLEDVPEHTVQMAEQVTPGFFDAPFDLPYTLQFREYKKARAPTLPE